MPYSLINLCARLLVENKLTIAFAESTTCGKINAYFSSVSESKLFLKKGCVFSDKEIIQYRHKSDVDHKNGGKIVPLNIAEAICLDLQNNSNANIIIGIAGKGSGSDYETNRLSDGVIHAHATLNGNILFVRNYNFQGDDQTVITQITMQIAYHIRNSLNELIHSREMVNM